MADIQTSDDLVQWLEELKEATQTWDAENGVPADWPDDFSLKPIMGGQTLVSVPQEDGEPIVYSAWLQRDEAGAFDQVVLLTPEHAAVWEPDDWETLQRSVSGHDRA